MVTIVSVWHDENLSVRLLAMPCGFLQRISKHVGFCETEPSTTTLLRSVVWASDYRLFQNYWSARIVNGR